MVVGLRFKSTRSVFHAMRFGLQLCATLLLALIIAWGYLGVAGHCQTTDNEDTPRITNPLDEELSGVTLGAAIYLKDTDGPMVYEPRITLQELQEFREAQSGLAGAPYQFTKIQITGKVEEDHLALQGDFEIELGPRVQKAEIPLFFGTCQLGITKPVVQSENTVSQFFADDTGYRWLLLSLLEQNDTPSQHTISLAGKSRITRDSDRNTIRLPLPQYPTRVTLSLPKSADDIKVRQDEIVETQATDDGLLVTVDTNGGDFTLSWRVRQAVARAASIEVESDTAFTVAENPDQAWRAKTSLNLQWYGSDTSNILTVRLPTGAQWRALPQSGFGQYAITSIDPREADPNAASDGPVLLRIENFDPLRNTSISVDLEWTWLPTLGDTSSSREQASLAVPFVEGASQHRGTIDCLIPSQYAVTFNLGTGTQLVGQSRIAEGLGSQQLRFSFTKEQFNVGMTFRREESLPTIRPTYHVALDKNKLVMTAWLACSFDVNQRIQLGLNFGDWRLQENTAKVLSAPEDLLSDDGEILTVTTRQDDVSMVTARIPELTGSRRIEQVWKLVAEKSWTPDEDGQLEFRVPEISRFGADGTPVTDHGSGALIVSSEDSLEPEWNETLSTSLLEDSFSTEYQRYISPQQNRKPLAYRFQSKGTTPTWSGRARVLPQAVSIVEFDRVSFGRDGVMVEQKLDFQVANIPLSSLKFLVRSDAIAGDLTFELNGELIANQVIETSKASRPESPDTASDSTPRDARQEIAKWQVVELLGLPELMGRFTVKVTSMLSQPSGIATNAIASNGNVPVKDSAEEELTADVNWLDPNVPFNCPFAILEIVDVAPAYRRSLSFSTADSLQANLAVAGESLSLDDEQLPIAPDVREAQLGLLQQSDTESLAKIRVNRSWLQTAIDGQTRKDRFVAEISSDEPQVVFYLPAQAYARNPTPQILLDGRHLRQPDWKYDAAQDRYIVNLESSPKQTHTFEVFYSVRNNLDSWSPLEIYPPSIQDAEFAGRFYWQLATPKTTHLLWSPAELSAEWQWHWEGLFWHRESTRTESGLVDLLGAYQWDQLPASVNHYLMSGRFPTQPLRSTVVSRYVLWFPIGILAITITSLVLNYPFFRQPAFGFALALVIISVGMVAPDVGILVGQTAVVALGLVAMVITTQAAINSRLRRRSVFTQRPSTFAENSAFRRPDTQIRSTGGQPVTTEKLGSSVAAGGGK